MTPIIVGKSEISSELNKEQDLHFFEVFLRYSVLRGEAVWKSELVSMSFIPVCKGFNWVRQGGGRFLNNYKLVTHLMSFITLERSGDLNIWVMWPLGGAIYFYFINLYWQLTQLVCVIKTNIWSICMQ